MINQIRFLEFKGRIDHDEDISAIQSYGERLFIGADEEHKIQVLKATKKAYTYKVEFKIELAENQEEIDIEGITRYENVFYAIGSHSRKRKRIRTDKSYQENLTRLATIEPEPSRNSLVRFTFEPGKSPETPEIERFDLRELLSNDPYLGPFIDVPSKENGIDIEGIAVDETETLYLGFRGPVLRGNYTPVLVARFETLPDYEVRFVNLGGNGIRDIAQVKDGFIILSGPMGDREGPYRLLLWDGSDGVPGSDRTFNPLLDLGEVIPPVVGAKPEGLDVIDETASYYQAIIVCDSAKKGCPMLVEVGKPLIDALWSLK